MSYAVCRLSVHTARLSGSQFLFVSTVVRLLVVRHPLYSCLHPIRPYYVVHRLLVRSGRLSYLVRSFVFPDVSGRSGCVLPALYVRSTVASFSGHFSFFPPLIVSPVVLSSLVVLNVGVFVSVWPCLFGSSNRSCEMVRNYLAYVTIYVTIYVIIWSRLSILCLFSPFFFLSFCSSCLSGLFW